jgi:universal stress protein E
VLRKKHDLVMLAAEGSGGAKAPLFGSTSMHLMRKCPCPVWVIKPTRRRHYKRVLAAVDVDAPTPESSSLNNKILGIALSLARLEGSELHVFHAWSWLGGSLVRGRIGSAETNQWQREIRSSRKGLLDSLLQEFDMEGVAVSSHLAKGEARWLIPRFAKKKGIDVIVMGTVCRTGIAGLLIGNTAERILQDVNCSVLALKPDGFATPITLER